MSFKDKTFKDRFQDQMWHHSEDKFEQRWPYRYERFGLDQDDSSIDTWALDPFIRHTPDYVCQLAPRGTPLLVEVQGTGKDQLHKFKRQKLDMLGKWNRIQDTWFWLWDDRAGLGTMISVPTVQLLIAQGKASEGSFDGKRPYWALPVDIVVECSDWTPERKERYQ